MRLSFDAILWMAAISLFLVSFICMPIIEARGETIAIPSLVVGVQNLEIPSTIELPNLSSILSPIEKVNSDLSITSVELVKRSV